MRRIGRQYRRGVGETLRSEDKKFGVGQNPIEQERMIDVIKPTDKATTDRLLEMINQMYPTASPHQQQALDFWRIQLAQGNMTDQVKYEFLQRFHMWLLGRGNEVDTSKTLWGRGNAAVHNPQVAAYIDQFAKKRLEYALLLSLLQNRVPETLNGYYLYFKYIVNGNLKLATAPDGTSFYDLSHEDFLADFDMMVQEFEKDRPGYAEIIKPAMQRPANIKPFGGEGATPSDPYPAAWRDRKSNELNSKANDQTAVQSMANRYGINAVAQSGKGGAGGPAQPFGGSAENQGGEYVVESAAKEVKDTTNDTSDPSIIPFTDASGFADETELNDLDISAIDADKTISKEQLSALRDVWANKDLSLMQKAAAAKKLLTKEQRDFILSKDMNLTDKIAAGRKMLAGIKETLASADQTLNNTVSMEMATPAKDKAELTTTELNSSRQPHDPKTGQFMSKSDTAMGSVVGDAVQARDSWMEKESDTMQHSQPMALYNESVSEEIKYEKELEVIAAQMAKMQEMLEKLEQRKKNQ